MSNKLKLLIVALVLIVGGVLAMAFGDTRGEPPALECVAEGQPSSGFVDHDQNDCPVSVESWDEYAEWVSQPRPVIAVGFLAALAGVGLGIGVGVTAIVQKARRKNA